jgi:hypothetical protein
MGDIEGACSRMLELCGRVSTRRTGGADEMFNLRFLFIEITRAAPNYPFPELTNFALPFDAYLPLSVNI